MPASCRNTPNNLHKNKELYPLRHLAGRGKEKPFAAPCRQGGRKNLLEKVLSFPPCTPSILFQNFLCSLFHFALHAKMKKRDISFENEEGQEENARVCLLSGMLSVCTVTLVDFRHIFCTDLEARERSESRPHGGKRAARGLSAVALTGSRASISLPCPP